MTYNFTNNHFKSLNNTDFICYDFAKGDRNSVRGWFNTRRDDQTGKFDFHTRIYLENAEAKLGRVKEIFAGVENDINQLISGFYNMVDAKGCVFKIDSECTAPGSTNRFIEFTISVDYKEKSKAAAQIDRFLNVAFAKLGYSLDELEGGWAVDRKAILRLEKYCSTEV